MKQLKIKNILVPVDFSAISNQAITFAKRMAARFDASVHLVHIHEFYYPEGFSPLPIGLPAVVPDWSVTLAEQMEARFLQDLKALAARSGVSADRCYVRHGAPIFDEICQCAEDIRADLIVAPTHGQSGIKRFVLGSTAERLVQHSPCPVLVTPDQETAGTPGFRRGIERILVPVDFSCCSMAGLNYAVRLARRLAAHLTVLHVIDFGFALTADGYAMYDLSRYQDLARKEGEKTMDRFLRQVAFDGVKCDSEVVTDLFANGLNDAIANGRIDLVVLATHGRTGLKHVLTGSTAELIVRRATCPVLVVPSHRIEREKNLIARRRRGHPAAKLPARRRILAVRPLDRHAATKRLHKIEKHPFPERRRTNKFRETHPLVTK